MPWRFHLLSGPLVVRRRQQGLNGPGKELSKMPKMKTKSAAKKRFKVTATGKVVSAAAGKRHGMIKRSNKFIRNARGTMVLAEPDARKVVKNFLPNL
jgi:large subunit ribosomal protein L35